MSAVVGIDLGTTNTVVAAVRGGQAFALADESGSKLIPSVVSFHTNGAVLVGDAARQRRFVDPANTIFSVKRLIGRAWESDEVRRARARFPFEMRQGPGQATLIAARGETYTLPEISAFVLRKAKAIAEAALGETVERAVITVPANFNDLQRAATKVAGRVAGLEVMRILNEPTAAALAYGYGRKHAERVAIYDFGGGTFDVTLLDMSNNVFEVLATAGNTFLGGDDVDLAIAEKMADEFLVQHNSDLRSDPASFERIRAAAESLKMKLTSEPRAHVEIRDVGPGEDGAPVHLSFSMARSELDLLSLPIIDRTFDVCRQALGIARLQPSDFDQVLLVGGSTRMPLVKRRVEEFFKRSPLANISPDEVVAIGAAIQAHALTGSDRRRSTIPLPPTSRTSAPPSAVPVSENLLAAESSRAASPAPSVNELPKAPRTPIVVPPPGNGPVDPSLYADTGRRRGTTASGLGGLARGQLSMPPRPPETLTGLGARGRVRTGAGLGPEAAQARQSAPAGPSPATTGPNIVSALRQTGDAARTGRGASEGGSPFITEESVRFKLEELDVVEEEEATVVTRTTASMPTVPLDFDESTRVLSAAPAVPKAQPAPAAATAVLTLERQLPVPEPPPNRRHTAPPPPSALAPPLPALPSSPPAAGTAAHELGTARSSAPPPLLIDVTPLSLCVETAGGYADVLIERNMPVPCERTGAFVTARDNQTSVVVRVSQGEAREFARNTVLGELELTGIPPAARGQIEIAVTFALDSDGILNVQAHDKRTGRSSSAVLRLIGMPDAQQIAALAARHDAHPAA
jgi:molecular chaperone DnaK